MGIIAQICRFRRARRQWSTSVEPQKVKQVLASLAEFESPSKPSAPPGPIFVFGTGFRTGSTLMQRILMTDRRLLLWGEPMGHAGVFSMFAESLGLVRQGWPEPHYFIGNRTASKLLHQTWIANLFPNPPDFRDALRMFVDRWLAQSAHDAGFARWGFKEVRLGAAEAYLLRWLYPDARFVVMTRDPCAAYHSGQRLKSNWLAEELWPARSIDKADNFAEVWNSLTLSWSDASDLRPIFLRYEDIVAGTMDFAALAGELSLNLDPQSALSIRAGGSPSGPPLSPADRKIIYAGTASGRRFLGY